MQGTWYTVSLEIWFTCIIFWGDKSQITPLLLPPIPESCMDAHKKYAQTLCSNGLLPCVQLWNRVWLLVGSWYLAPTSTSPWIQCFIAFSRCLHLNDGVGIGYPQAKQTLFFAGGRHWNCIFTVFEKIMGSKHGLCLSHEAGFTWLEQWLLIICRERRFGCCWRRRQTCRLRPCVKGRSALTPLSTRSTPWRVKIRVTNLFYMYLWLDTKTKSLADMLNTD